ncbi:MAG TPA: hypothetical protein DDZ51_09485 [Planctomycetaceae bacterium]|nr:hypothetical protein [Planctomycetaceae bacterium]
MKEESRKRTRKKYTYDNHRKNGKVVNRYIGPSDQPDVALVQSYDGSVSAKNKMAKAARKQERDDCNAAQPCIENIFTREDVLGWIRECYDEAGLPQVRNVDLGLSSGTFEGCDAASPTVTPAPTKDTRTSFEKLWKKVDKGDANALRQFRQILTENPQLVQQMTDFLSVIKEQIVSLLAGDSQSIRQTIETAIQNDIVRFLGDSQSCPIERLEAEKLLLLRLDYFRCHMSMSRAPENHSDAKFWESMATKSLRRYERAIEAYEKRRLARQRSRHDVTSDNDRQGCLPQLRSASAIGGQ